MLIKCAVLFVVICLCKCLGNFVDQVALPPAPTISLKPLKDLYTAGQPVAMTCSIFKNDEMKLFSFYRNDKKIFSLETLWKATLHIDTHEPGSGGKYSCDYQIKRLGTWINSIMRTVSITISGQTTEDTTLTTSLRLTRNYERNGKVTTKTPEANKSAETATKAVSMASISPTSKRYYEADVKTTSTTSTTINYSTASALLTKGKIIDLQQTDRNKQTTVASYTSTLPTSDNITESQQTTQNMQTTTDSDGWSWIYYVFGGCVLFILKCVLLVVLLLRGYFSRRVDER